ncbi:glycosyltransferase family 2 protein [Pontibacter fetidus]|uniref:Glycosyltransferase family 2 protein n=1 Tax=Pontibacter fetidus TaxID=2700082 RepID=A0A6B2GXM9_9BACT|nr:glycosyltransferase family A protein [Pontibacter fetidus]NDK55595.1 glycosyltransferase family 2 protein [Pontibacter fetidus]
MRPEFSVIIPVHNKLPHLERSVFSVLNQTYPHFELLLVDDASTDGSSEKLLEFDDSRIQLLRRDTPGPGGYAARNAGIQHATKKWVCFLDADDEWTPDVMETLARIVQEDAEVEILSWGWLKVKGNSRKPDPYSLKYKDEKIKQFTLTDFFNGPQPMWTGGISMKKELITIAGGFPETGFKRGGDMDTWIRCLWQSKKNLRITKPMTSYYLDSVNMVTKAVERDVAYSFSSSIQNIQQSTTDKRLKKAIRYFQNRRIYKILTEKVDGGKSIDYSLLFKMNLSLSFYYMCLKLHVKKLLIETRLRKPQL